MKKVTLIFIATFGGMISAQTISPHVISSAGSDFQNTKLQVDWTIGEVLIHTIEHNIIQITQGFHQPYLTITNTTALPEDIGQIHTFPNPVDSYLEVQIQLNGMHYIEMHFFDAAGKLYWTKSVEDSNLYTSVSTSSLASNAYFLRVKIDNLFSQTVQIQKLH
ncbi:MAG TPA: T9SS type A sorting domain-containing protein [Saprospiraceae bacterium]|nr:T9SS type A sorting domain-containing protein [Saprospiraceae bacterium]